MFEKENLVRLYAEGSKGGCLEIGPNPDAPEIGITLRTPDKHSKDWYGDINLVMDAKERKQLGQALIDFAESFEKDNA